MKKTKLYTALLSLSFSLNAFAMGLGDMKVNSSLDQPFDAEIELIDVGGTPYSVIKANLASAEDYHRAGLEQTFVLNDLTFVVEKNSYGHPVIKLRTVERISEPFIQLLIDLAWAKGQVYREYSILLDPPDYQLLVTQNARHVVHKHGGRPLVAERVGGDTEPPLVQPNVRHEIYGPTVVGETIWQIAHRYKDPGISLPQFILAIVGLNKDAFLNDNLNGLKVGARLTIPTTADAVRVPVLDAKREIEAHDAVWQSKQPIQHIVLPPYIEPPASEEGLTNESLIPSVPMLATGVHFIPSMNTYLSAGQDVVPSMYPTATHPAAVNPAFNTQMDIAAQAIETVRESNALLKEQLKSMQLQNKKLQKQLSQRDSDMSLLRSQVELLMSRQGVAGQVFQSSDGDHHLVWLWVLILLGVGAGGAYAGFRKWGVPDYRRVYTFAQGKFNPVRKDAAPQAAPIIETPTVSPVVDKTADFQEASSQASEHVVEFNTEPLIQPQPDLVVVTQEEVLKPTPLLGPIHDTQEDASNHSKQDEEPLNPTGPNLEEPVNEDPAVRPVKSTAALQTLLTLAETYIGMGDNEAANVSLREVLEYGNKNQKKAAKTLMDTLKKE